MLTPRYHVAYWAAAVSGVAVFRLLHLQARIPSAAVQLATSLLAVLTSYSSLTWQQHAKRTKLALCTHQVAVAYLLVAIGFIADNFQIPGDQSSKPTALIHALLAFVAVGFLESLRQNRRDIEPTTFYLLHRGPRSRLLQYSWRQFAAWLGSTIICNALLLCILALVDRILERAGGMSLRQVIPYWGWEKMHVQGRLGSTMATHFLGGPFADMAETIFYILCRKFVPPLDGPRGWMPKLTPLTLLSTTIPLLDSELMMTAMFWVPRVLVYASRGQTGGSVWAEGTVSGWLSLLGG